MAKERKALEKLLPGRRSARLAGFVLLFLALQLGLMSWFVQSKLAPSPALLDESSSDGEHVYINIVAEDGRFATDSEEMSYYFFLDQEDYLYVVRMDMSQYVSAQKALQAGGPALLEGTARTTPARLRELVIRSYDFVDELNYYSYFTVCYLDCTETPTFLPALLCLAAALALTGLALICFAVWLWNLKGRCRCMDRLEELGLLQEAVTQLGSTEGRTEFAPDILVTRDFLAVWGTGRICALQDVQATEMKRRFRLVLGDGSRLPVQHGLLPRLDARLLEFLCRLFRKE